jgi:hypothetical protein
MVPGAESRGFVAPRRAVSQSATASLNGKEPLWVEAEHTTSGFDGITTLPDHGANWAAQHVYTIVSHVFLSQILGFPWPTGDEALVERFLGEIFVVLLHVLFRWGDELQGNELVAAN